MHAETLRLITENDKLAAELEELERTSKLREKKLKFKIQMLQQNVIKPLMSELKISKEIGKRVQDQYAENFRELKAMTQIVRIPAMSTEF